MKRVRNGVLNEEWAQSALRVRVRARGRGNEKKKKRVGGKAQPMDFTDGGRSEIRTPDFHRVRMALSPLS